MRVRRKFIREFTQEAVCLVQERGVLVAEASEDLDLRPHLLRAWIKALAADPLHAYPGEGQPKPESAELTRLRRENAKLRMEKAILRKGRGLPRQGVAVKLGFVAKH